jgi:thimet oligopeptidase
MTLHLAQGPVDTQSLFNKLRVEVSGVQGREDTNLAATFSHLTGGYAAGYYGYLWSEVFSFDLFSVFKKNGVLDKTTGRRYRDIILAPGGTRDGYELLREFLGREPSQEAFLIGTGLKKK